MGKKKKVMSRPGYVSCGSAKEMTALVAALKGAGLTCSYLDTSRTVYIDPDHRTFTSTGVRKSALKAADLIRSMEAGEMLTIPGFSDYPVRAVDAKKGILQLGCQVGTREQARAIFELAKKQRRAKKPLDLLDRAPCERVLFGTYEVTRITSTGGVDSYGEVEPFDGIVQLMELIDPPRKK